MRSLVLVLVLLFLPVVAHAGQDHLDLALGAGVGVGETPGWAIRLDETIEMSHHREGFIYGSRSGYDYWRSGTSSGFFIPIGGFAGVKTGSVISTFSADVGVLAFESWRGDGGFGVVPQAGTALGFALDDVRTVMIDARVSRHVLAGCPDFTTWSVLLMIGKTLDH